MKKVAICMATYNGERFIENQINSIISQTYQNWNLYIRDDGSQDKTKDIIHTFAKNNSNIFIVENDNFFNEPSSASNFLSILRSIDLHEFDYFMFSDQDDIWHVNKIELMVSKINATENNQGVPCLIHSDLKVVDEDLNVLSESFFNYRALNPNINSLNRLLIQNNITGCTMIFNKKLIYYLNFLTPNSKIAMHDWWISLVAASFGNIDYVENATIDYRQHSSNVVGATNVRTLSFIVTRLVGKNKVKATIQMAIEQAESFLNIYEDELNLDQKEILKKFIKLKKYNKLRRIQIIFKNKFLKQGIIQIIGETIFI